MSSNLITHELLMGLCLKRKTFLMGSHFAALVGSVDQAGLSAQSSPCLCLKSAGIKGVRRHHPRLQFFLLHFILRLDFTM